MQTQRHTSGLPAGPSLLPRLPQYLVAILHVGYWGLYVLLLVLMIIGTRSTESPWRMLFGTTAGFLLIVPNVIAFYVQYAILTPRFFPTRRFVLLAVLTVITGVCTSVLCAAILAASAGGIPAPLRLWRTAVAFISWMTVLALIHMTIAMVMRGFISWYDDIAIKEQLQKRTGEVEAALIRAKLDPHFLFNTLNNIDVLIMRDAARASAYVNQLSDILRFVLYEARADRVALSSELGYLDKYIGLQRIRIANPRAVSYELSGATEGLAVAPMLLIPFVENAFKHAAGQRDDNSIVVGITVDERDLTFVCSNAYAPAREVSAANDDLRPVVGGLGKDLMQQRLQLLYPDRHTLAISDTNNRYSVRLTLQLEKAQLNRAEVRDALRRY